MSKAYKKLTAAEARTAFYLDFEGGKDADPVLAGYLRKGPVVQTIVDPLFAELDLPSMSLLQAIKTVVTRAKKQERRIITWSEHDLEIVRSTKDGALIREFEARYGNARALAARWATRSTGVEKPDTGDLERYFELTGFEVPEAAGPGQVGGTIRSFRERLAAGRPPTEMQMERWADLLEHNRYDCEGTRFVAIRAATDLERLDERDRKAKSGRKHRRHKGKGGVKKKKGPKSGQGGSAAMPPTT